MTLAPGTRLGSYEVLGPLGVGAMGEVYRAKDSRLGREVAIKVLPEHFASDEERLKRFEREAKTLAALNHPNIAQIFGVDQIGDTCFLVLELVLGESLDERLQRGALPLDEALHVCKQITEGLEAAHEAGVIHRDLKPANVRVTPEGKVKVIDFGLAKPIRDAHDVKSTTDSVLSTEQGRLLGTPTYMAPEQARGRPIDKRVDIWAFGCVLYECLTARRPFAGETLTDVLASVLEKEPDWTLLPPGTPLPIRRVLRRCLEKDRTRRLADIADARLDLDERVTDAASSATLVAQPAKSATLRRWLPWSVAVACAVSTLWLAGLTLRDRPAAGTEVVRSSILLPGRLLPVLGPSVALSPDGRRLAFVASDAAGRSQLWIRMLDSLAAQPIPDSAGAYGPFWSPDSRWLAFVQHQKLKKIEASGGQAVTLCDEAMIGGGAWSRDGVILFTQRPGALVQVLEAGGTPVPLTRIGSKGAEIFSSSPSFLPDGRHFVYVETTTSHTDVYLAALDAPAQQTSLSLDATAVQYARGFLWFLRGSTLMAQPFDAESRTLVGEAVPIEEQLAVGVPLKTGIFSVSAAGTLVFQTDPSPGWELAWYDREGRQTGVLGTPAEYADPRLSPDGRRLLVTVVAAGTQDADLWIFDVARGLPQRFTFEDSRPMRGGIWSPDGGRIAFATRRNGRVALVQKASSGEGGEEVLLEDEFEKELNSWSPDGRFIVYSKRSGGEPTPWILPLEGDRKPFALAQARTFYSLVSPDGRWIASMSRESGRWEIYVAPFLRPGGSLRVSPAGGLDPQWRADGKEIFYLGLNRQLMSAAVTLDRDRVEVGEVKPLFELPKVGPRATYDVSPDGQSILAVTQPAQATSIPLTLIVNWPALLEK